VLKEEFAAQSTPVMGSARPAACPMLVDVISYQQGVAGE